MKNLLKEPFIGFTGCLVFLLLSLSGSIFLWILKGPYSDLDNLQFGHILGSQAAIKQAQFSLTVASLFYALLFLLMVFQLILHIQERRRRSWDPSIAMVDVHTPRPKRESTPSSTDSTTHLAGGFSREFANERISARRRV